MKIFFRVLNLIVISLVIVSLIGCGSKASDSGNTDKMSSASAAALTNANTSVPDASVTVDNLLGNWVDIKDATRFAKITKTDAGYQYEDNDAKYQGVYAEGVLQIKVTETDTGDVYFDDKQGMLILDFQGDVTKFKKN